MHPLVSLELHWVRDDHQASDDKDQVKADDLHLVVHKPHLVFCDHPLGFCEDHLVFCELHSVRAAPCSSRARRYDFGAGGAALGAFFDPAVDDFFLRAPPSVLTPKLLSVADCAPSEPRRS